VEQEEGRSHEEQQHIEQGGEIRLKVQVHQLRQGLQAQMQDQMPEGHGKVQYQ
jgi:hypothetical protein